MGQPPRRRGGQRPDSARFVCGAMAVPHGFACVRRAANRSTGAASQQREHNEMPSAKLANDSTPQVLRRSLPGLGIDDSCNDTARKFRSGLGSAGAPTNLQTGKRIRPTARARARRQASVRAAADAVHRCAARGLPWEAAHTHRAWVPAAARWSPRASRAKK